MKHKILARGAEAIISLRGNKIIKNRIKKSYRLSVIDDKLRKQRTKSETKIINKLKNIINVPKIIKTENNQIIMQHIKGKKLSEHLDSLKNQSIICKKIGKQAASLHDSDIIHGDLTTSNMILADKNNEIYFIDFGLSFHSHRIEDKAVDIHLLRQALEAKHFKKWEKLFSWVLKGYNSEDKPAVLQQLKIVESRGRYKKH